MKAGIVLTLALGLAIPFAATPPAEAGSRKGVTTKSAHTSARTYKRVRKVRRARPQVRGFRVRFGGYSYRNRDRLEHDIHTPPPSDFGPYLDVSPSPNGIIPTGPYN